MIKVKEGIRFCYVKYVNFGRLRKDKKCNCECSRLLLCFLKYIVKKRKKLREIVYYCVCLNIFIFFIKIFLFIFLYVWFECYIFDILVNRIYFVYDCIYVLFVLCIISFNVFLLVNILSSFFLVFIICRLIVFK